MNWIEVELIEDDEPEDCEVCSRRGFKEEATVEVDFGGVITDICSDCVEELRDKLTTALEKLITE